MRHRDKQMKPFLWLVLLAAAALEAQGRIGESLEFCRVFYREPGKVLPQAGLSNEKVATFTRKDGVRITCRFENDVCVIVSYSGKLTERQRQFLILVNAKESGSWGDIPPIKAEGSTVLINESEQLRAIYREESLIIQSMTLKDRLDILPWSIDVES